MITPGAGRDVIRIDKLSDTRPGYGERDAVSGFEHGRDKFDFSRLDSNPNKAGVQHDWKFIGDSPFHRNVGAEIRFENGILQINVDGDRTADAEIVVTGGTVTASDIIFS
ncbi:hypothetical protein M9M90_00955 [Phenylobacterium sp. LH3H17]|nr:hypothetical protein M9M90_00955 [Phenylobacterium sp. LH3H17]